MRFNHRGVVSEIDNLPGCSQIAVFHSTFLPPDARGKGLGGDAHYDRIAEARLLGYDAAVCTCMMTNRPQVQILEKAGWKVVHQFTSDKTGNLVGLWVRGL